MRQGADKPQAGEATLGRTVRGDFSGEVIMILDTNAVRKNWWWKIWERLPGRQDTRGQGVQRP